MLTLLKKRQARIAAKAAIAAQSEQQPDVATTAAHSDETQRPHRPGLEDRPWDEIGGILKKDLEYARTLPGAQDKIPFKKELIKKYSQLVKRLLATHKDNLERLDVVWWFYLWNIDVGLLPLIHDEFKAAILNGLDTPDDWKSDGYTAYCDIIFKYTFDAHKEKKSLNAAYLLDAVKDVIGGAAAIPAPLKVKMFRLAGDLLRGSGNPEEALALFEKVMVLSPSKGGCKTKVKELKEELGHEQ